MKSCYCWRTKKHEKMLDEEKWNVVISLSEANTQNYLSLRLQNITKKSASVILHRKMVDAYNELTDSCLDYEDWHLIQYFRLKDYGELCIACDRPLRSQLAKFCAECGNVKL